MRTPTLLAALALAGAGGTLCRYGLGLALARLLPGGDAAAWATCAINAAGCLLFGALVAALPAGASPLRVVLGVGFLGAFTTYATFAFEGTAMLHAGRTGAALLYIAVQTVLGVACVAAGWWVGLRFAQA